MDPNDLENLNAMLDDESDLREVILACLAPKPFTHTNFSENQGSSGRFGQESASYGRHAEQNTLNPVPPKSACANADGCMF